ncbi:MAG: superinfection immunity protein [Acidobacteriota bacterium]|nr:superinfection immunity protein [Acidobacteriota bacterium]
MEILSGLVAMSSGDRAAGIFAGALGLLFLLFVILVALLFYFLPTIIAIARHHPSALLIGLINFLLGWSLIAWIVCIVWSFADGRR